MRNLKPGIPWVLPILAIVAVSSLLAAQRQNPGFGSPSVSMDGPVDDCGDIRVRFDRTSAMTDQTETTVFASRVSTLRTQPLNGGAFVVGWDRNEYSIKTCKAVPQDDPNAGSTWRDIVTNITRNLDIALSGPSDRVWTANLIVMVPRSASMNLETRNGPLSLRDVAGNTQVTATNGPVSLQGVGGFAEVTTMNGPISLSNGSGDQRLTATNGPINVESCREAVGMVHALKCRQGTSPLSLSIPDGYGSGVSIQTSDWSPVSCAGAGCAGATRTLGSPSTYRFGSGDPVVRLTTSNGPLSIRSGRN